MHVIKVDPTILKNPQLNVFGDMGVLEKKKRIIIQRLHLLMDCSLAKLV